MMKSEHMDILARCLYLLVVSLIFMVLPPGTIQAQLALGGENLVNSTTADRQANPAIAMDTAGNYIVVWESLGQDGSGYGIYFQRYNSDGTPNGSETQVNTYTANDQRHPDVAMGYDGNFSIVWMSKEQDGEGWGVYRRSYDNTGSPVSGIIRNNSGTSGHQRDPKVAADKDGNFVVVWTETDLGGTTFSIQGRRCSNTGASLAAEFQVNASPVSFAGSPSIASDSTGNFMVVWQSSADGDGNGIQGVLYDSTGAIVSADLSINSNTAGNQIAPDIACLADGNYIITWASFAEDGDGYGVYAKIVDDAGATVLADFLVNGVTAGSQEFPRVAAAIDRGFIVTWSDYGQDGSYTGQYASIYSTDGIKIAGDSLVNTTTTDFQQFGDIAWSDYEKKAAFAWQSGFRFSSTTQDGDDYGIYSAQADVTICIPAEEPSLTGVPGTYCPGDNQIINLSGDIKDAAQWVLYSGSCGGTKLDSTTGTSFTVSVTSSTTYYVRGEGNCADVGPCGSITLAPNDTTPPSAICTGGLSVYLDGSGNASITSGDIDGGSSDNCAVSSLTAAPSSFNCSNLGANAVTLTVTDNSSNTDTCMATITVIDTVSPTAVCQDIGIHLDGSGNATITAGDVDNGSSDNCTISSLSIAPSSFTCSNLGTNTVTLTVTDNSSNSATCTSTVTVIDSTAPTAVCQDLSVYLDVSGNATVTAGDVDNGSSDNCTISSVTATPLSFNCANLGANTVTLTVTDNSSNSSTCTSTVTVIDSTPPTAACQDLSVYLDGTGNASITSGDVDNGSSDNCTGISVTAAPLSFDCSSLGANTVVLTVTDNASNSSTCTSTVTVIDSVSPTAVCQNLTVYLDGSGNATITAGDVDNGSSDNCTLNTVTATPLGFTCANIGTNTVTLTATDNSGNSATCTSTVTVLDSTPSIAICQDISVYLDAGGNASIVADDVNNGSGDNCTVSSITASPLSFSCTNLGANTVTLTVVDNSSNSSTCTSTVTVIDSTPPSAVCQNISVYLDGAGNASIVAGDVDNGSNDNCTVSSVTAAPLNFTCANLGANTVTLTVTDNSSNSSTCTSTVTVIDSTPPLAVCQNLILYLDGSGNASITANDVDNGSTDNCTISSVTATPLAFTCSNVGSNIVTLTVTDNSGNSSTCSAGITVADTTSPTALCQNISIYLDNSGTASITPSDIDNGSSDNCTISKLAATPFNFTCANLGANTVSLIVTDDYSNSSTCTSIVTVIDSTPPTAICQNLSIYLDGAGNASINSGDVDNGSNDNCTVSSVVASPLNFSCANLGANTVTLTITDNSSNSSTCTSTVTVFDSIPPVAVCQNLTVALDNDSSISITAGDIDGGSTDNCTVSSVSATPLSFTCANLGANTVTLTITDDSGNSSTCTATVTVLDSVPPTTVCVNTTVYLNNAGAASIVPADVDGGSFDNCNGSVTISVAPANFACTNLGANTVTLTVTDSAGNSSSCNAVVTVLDTIPPTANCKNTTVHLDGSGQGSITAGSINNGSSDNCTISSVTASNLIFGCLTTGTNIITLTVTDNSSNSSTCTGVVTVIDSTSPTVICQNVTAYLDINGDAPVSWPDIDAGSSDNCSYSVTSTIPVFGCGDLGPNTFTIILSDPSGNTGSCSPTVTVVDTIPPTFTVPPAITIYADSQCNFDASVAVTGDVTDERDNCGSGQAVSSDSVVNIPNTTDRLITRTWTLDDGNGSNLIQVQLITVLDTLPVEFSLLGANPFDIPRNATTPIPGFIARDNCLGDLSANVTVDSSQLDRNLPATYDVIYTLVYTDAAGVQQTEVLTRTVNVTGGPSIQPLHAHICLGQTIDIGALIRDYSLQAFRFEFYNGDPTAGGSLFAISPAYRGRVRYPVRVSPTVTTSYWVRTRYISGAFVDIEVIVAVSNCGGNLSPVVMLEGPYDATTGQMRNRLQQQNLLPATEPYTAAGYQFVNGGGEQMQATALTQSLVDWVVVELRDSTDPTVVAYSRAALLRTDGRITDMDGVSPVNMQWAIPGSYHVVIRHRNHLAVMTQYTYQVHPGGHARLNLANPQTRAFGSNSQTVQNGTAMMYAGDADGNGQIQNTDHIFQWQPQVGTAGYQEGDFNLDGQVQNSDLVLFWRPNSGRGSAVPR